MNNVFFDLCSIVMQINTFAIVTSITWLIFGISIKRQISYVVVVIVVTKNQNLICMSWVSFHSQFMRKSELSKGIGDWKWSLWFCVHLILQLCKTGANYRIISGLAIESFRWNWYAGHTTDTLIENSIVTSVMNWITVFDDKNEVWIQIICKRQWLFTHSLVRAT